MNYHIITQDKFFNRYIEDIYDLHLEDENVFWVQGNFGDYPYLTTSHKIEYLTNDKEHIINRLTTYTDVTEQTIYYAGVNTVKLTCQNGNVTVTLSKPVF